MKPEDAYAELTTATSQPEQAQNEVKMHPGSPPALAGLLGSINDSYFLLRRWIAIVALAMPVLMWLAGVMIGRSVMPRASLSAYYFEPGNWARDVFVGGLCVVGFFLYFYKGYTKREDQALNVAGICAILVALSPMNCGTSCPVGLHRPPWDGVQAIGSVPIGIHGIGALILFLLIAYVCVWQSSQTLELIRDSDQRIRFKRIYGLLGVIMVVLPAAAISVNWLAQRKANDGITVFLMEVCGIFAFGIYWLVKSREIDAILKQ